jgi:hypothetical protein
MLRERVMTKGVVAISMPSEDAAPGGCSGKYALGHRPVGAPAPGSDNMITIPTRSIE